MERTLKTLKKHIDRSIKNIKYSLFGEISSTVSSKKTVYIRFGDDEELRDVRIMGPYGFSSMPGPGNYGQVLFNNSSKNAVLIGVEDSEGAPVELEIGESILYNNIGESYMHFKNDGKIYVKGEIVNV